jgi:hypothetical protein
MSTSFDVYHKWLSIPPSEQPPNHYRLLGLGLFESDPDVIAAAADRQMSHVQTYKNGPRAELSQKLLNEIASAKLCLLKLQKKEAYDEQLRQRLAELQPAAVPLAAPALAHPGATIRPPTGGGATINAGRTGVASNPLPPPPIAAPPRFDQFDSEDQRSPWGTTAVLTAGAVLILLLIIAIWAVLKLGRGGESSIQANSPSISSTGDAAVKPNQAAETSNVPKTGEPTTPPAAVPTLPESPSKVTDPSVAPPTDPPTKAKPAEPAPNSTVKPSVVEPSATPTNNPATVKPLENSAVKRILVPDKTALTAANARFADAFVGATPQSVLEKAKTLTDGPLVYVALNYALEGAISGGDVPLVGQTLDELSRRFTVDALPLRAKSYVDLRQHVATTPDWEMLAESTLALVDEATAAGHTDLAIPLAETSLLAARKANNLELIRKATLKVLLLQAQGSGAGGRGSEVGR